MKRIKREKVILEHLHMAQEEKHTNKKYGSLSVGGPA